MNAITNFLAFLIGFFGIFMVMAGCALLKPTQSRSVCDSLVSQIESAKDAGEVEKLSKVYQKHGCA